MLPPIVTKSLEHATSVIYSFMAIAVVGSFIAMLLARTFGGKSPIMRNAIFSFISFCSLCAAAYYAMNKLSSGG